MKQHFGGFLAVLILVGAGLVAIPADAAVVAAPTCVATLVDVPAAPTTTKLFGLDAVSRGDAWAVGESIGATGGGTTLIEHWDGTSWSVSPSPTVAGALFRVQHLSSNDVWVVGRQGASGVVSEHWNGTAWTVIPMPTPPGTQSIMLGLAIRSDNDIWAVGFSGAHAVESALMDHWDGTAWTAYPGAPQNAALHDASLLPNGQIWAVGRSFIGTQGQTQNLAMLFDGTTWQTVPTPNTTTYQNLLHGVVAISPSDVWAVGFDTASGASTPTAQSAHWDGSTWTMVPMVVPPGGNSRPRRVAALSSGDVWAVGDGPAGPLVEHWTGGHWSLVAGPPTDALPFGVTALSESMVWISGTSPSLQRICPVQIGAAGFAPTVVVAPQDRTTSWHVSLSAATTHSVTDGSGLGLFDSGPMSAGASYDVTLAGAGRYDVIDSGSATQGRITVPVQVVPTTGTTATAFTVTAAAPDLPNGLVEDVVIQRPGSSTFTAWQTLTSSTGFSAAFTPDMGPGTYQFASTTRNATTGAASRVSPPIAITVS